MTYVGNIYVQQTRKLFIDKSRMSIFPTGLGGRYSCLLYTSILDIGTGTGLISLMMAQRCNARIRAVDIDADAVEQARGNVAASPWQDRIEVELQDICHFTSETLFDVTDDAFYPVLQA